MTLDFSDIRFRGDRLRELRQRRKISADRLARAADLTTHHIFRLEREARPHVWGITIAKLARALGTTADYLLGLTDNPDAPNKEWSNPCKNIL